MPDAMSVELKILGIEQAGKDLMRFASELRELRDVQISRAGGSGRGSYSQDSPLNQERELAKLAKIRQDAQLRNERHLAQQRKERQKQEEKEAKEAEKRRKEEDKKLNAPWDKVQRLLSSSRFSIGKGGEMNLMPLLGQFTSLFGEFAGPVGLATGALTLLYQTTQQAAQSMRDFRQAELTGGGDRYETAQAQVIGRVLGMDGKAIASDSRSFADRITTDPAAMAYANKYGISDTPGINGRIDKVQNLLKFADALRTMSDPEAIRAARATGTEDLLPLRDLSPDTYAAMRDVARAHAAPMSKEALRARANKDASHALFGQMTDDVKNGMGGVLERGVDGVRDFILSKLGLGSVVDHRNEDLKRVPSNQETEHTSAIHQNTQAIQGLNQLLRGGIYGGGERVRNAIPEAFNGAGWNTRQLRAQAHALGAFSA